MNDIKLTPENEKKLKRSLQLMIWSPMIGYFLLSLIPFEMIDMPELLASGLIVFFSLCSPALFLVRDRKLIAGLGIDPYSGKEEKFPNDYLRVRAAALGYEKSGLTTFLIAVVLVFVFTFWSQLAAMN